MSKTTGASPYAALVHLSGGRRGTSELLDADRIVLMNGDGTVLLTRRGHTFELHAEPGAEIFVNGEAIEELVLASGDVIELSTGEVLRFRLYPASRGPYKSLREAFSDCVDCARFGGDGALDKAGIFLGGVPYELATKTAPLMRATLLVLLTASISLAGVALSRGVRLERRLTDELGRIEGLEALLESAEHSSYSTRDFESARAELEQALSASLARVEALEERADAIERVIADAADSIVFLQGAYGFIDTGSGRPLRYATHADGRPWRLPSGDPATTLEGDGPIVEILYSGTAFVATADGRLLTNRHVALPWLYDETAQRIAAQGLQPVMQRLIGFLPGLAEPFDVQLVEASDTADVAVLRCEAPASSVRGLTLAAGLPDVGDEVIVMGYPTGIRALMARAGERFAAELAAAGPLDFWQVARRLAEGGFTTPLTTRGIVGQMSTEAIVYDAATIGGGSGGPVIDMNGEVVAVNVAIVPGFTGSNLGVPISEAARLLEQH